MGVWWQLLGFPRQAWGWRRPTICTKLVTGPDGDTALHLACLYGHKPCVEALVAAGCALGPVNTEDGTTPLHDAAAGGYLELVQLLVDKSGCGMIPLQVCVKRRGAMCVLYKTCGR